MNLRQKTLLLISLLLVGLIAVLSASLSAILLGSFSQLETRNTRRNVQRVQAALDEELQKLNLTVEDWAEWDDTYGFIQQPNEAFLRANLGEGTLNKLKINVLLFLNSQGEQIVARGFDLQQQQATPLPNSFQPYLRTESILLNHPTLDSSITGLIALNNEVLAIASQPIVRSDGTGPIRGTLMMGRYLDRAQIQALSQRTQLSIRAHPTGRQLPPHLQDLYAQLTEAEIEPSSPFTQAPIEIVPLNADTIAGYTLLRDVGDRPILLLEIEIPREIYQQGQSSLYYLIISLLAAGVAFSIAILWLLERVVLRRLTRLSADVEQVGTNNDLSLRVKTSGRDELTRLAETINGMLEKLEVGAKALAAEREKAEQLLLNVLPEPIADRLKQSQSAIAEHFDEVTILFADIVGFTPLSARLKPIELVNFLNQIFSTFDRLAEQYQLEKIKTIGDAYMVAAGLPLPRADHASAIAEMALAMQAAIEQFQQETGEPLQIRIGINSGVVIAGVIGKKKFIYDLWGDAVNIASRMESSGEPGSIQVTQATYEQLRDRYRLEERGIVAVKGRGEMVTYWLKGKLS